MDRTKNMCIPPEFTADMMGEIVREVVERSNRMDELAEIVGDYDLDRLRQLVQADRDGRCVVLPCKVGDVLYSAFPLCGINTHQVRKFERNSEGDFACSALMIPFSDFGKRVFLNREAAEAALKETEG